MASRFSSVRGSRRSQTRALAVERLESRKVLSAAALAGPLQGIVVVLNDDVADSRAAAAELIRQPGQSGSVQHVYQHALKGFSAQVYSAKAMQNNSLVKYVEPNGVMQALGQSLPSGVDRVDADLNVAAGIDGTDQRVDVDIAIIDTGIDIDHPDLYVVGGVRFFNDGGPWWNPKLGQDDNYDDDNGHGTHVAGSAAALDNGVGVVGVAPGARLWAVKVLDANGSGTYSQVIAGMDWVAARADTIEVANMSLGGSFSQSVNDALQGMTDKGIVVAVAAGNDGADAGNYSPASAPSAITVSAVVESDGQAGGLGSSTSYGADDTLASFSNYGSVVDIAAPGVNITSTYPGGGYTTYSGTSMASPHVAGAVALELAARGRDRDGNGSFDGADVAAITNALLDSGQPMAEWRSDTLDTDSDPDGINEPMAYVGGAVDTVPTVGITAPAEGASVSGSVNVSASATDDEGVAQVEFFVGSQSLGIDSDSSDGWSITWITTGVADGSHQITATATDSAGQTASDTVVVEVDNVDDLPTVSITHPTAASTVSGSLTVSADAVDDRGVAQVEFVAGGILLGTDKTSSDGWSALWDTTGLVDGSHELTATATDSAGQISSHSILVSVDNSITTMHVADLDGAAEENKNRWRAAVTVLVVDAAGLPLPDATVTGDWSGGSTGSVNITTDSSGRASVVSDWVHKNNGSIQFAVTGVTHASLSYQSGDNTDPDGDSNGTAIIINKDGTTAAPQSTIAATDAVLAGSLDDLFVR